MGIHWWLLDSLHKWTVMWKALTRHNVKIIVILTYRDGLQVCAGHISDDPAFSEEL